jgi:hypothetical protein
MNPPLVMLPTSVYLESKALASGRNDRESYERFMGRWTHLGSDLREVPDSIRQDLTQSIADILPLIQDETRYAFSKEIGTPKDWTGIRVYPTMLKMVALLSGRVFVGYPLNRNDAWLDASINYTTALAGVMRDSITWNPFVLPFVAPWLSSIRRANVYLKKAREWMTPLVSEALAEKHLKKSHRDTKAGSRGTLISWLLNHLPERLHTPERIALDQMVVGLPLL